MRGLALRWFSSFLSGRRQATVVDDAISEFSLLYAGVPQGAILSPLLFSVYMNDIYTSRPGKINLFADDTSIYVTAKTEDLLCCRLQTAVDVTNSWFQKWLLTVNSAKSAVLVFRSQKMSPVRTVIYVDGHVLPQVTTHKHLGLVLGQFLTWTDHTDYIVNKVYQRLGLLRRLRGQLSGVILCDLYVTCVRPVIEYASVVWSGMAKFNELRLERANRRAARLITGISRAENCPSEILLALAGLQALSKRRRFFQALLVARFNSMSLPDHVIDGLCHWLNDSADDQQKRYPTRQANTLQLPRARKNVLQRSPFYSSFSLWNTLPPLLRSHTSATQLKDFFLS